MANKQLVTIGLGALAAGALFVFFRKSRAVATGAAPSTPGVLVGNSPPPDANAFTIADLAGGFFPSFDPAVPDIPVGAVNKEGIPVDLAGGFGAIQTQPFDPTGNRLPFG